MVVICYVKTDQKNEHNIREYDISGWWQKNLFQHNKLHPLTSRRGKLISETLYRDIETMIQGNLSLQRVENIS